MDHDAMPEQKRKKSVSSSSRTSTSCSIRVRNSICNRPGLILVASLLILLRFSLVFGQPVESMKYSFHVNHHSGALIGPVGVPFGFLEGGRYKLTVSNFQLSVASSFSKHKMEWFSRNKDKLTEEQGETLLNSAKAGFYLQKFDNEASFNEYMEELKSNRTRCAFEDINNGEISSAANGIFLSLKSRKNWNNGTVSINYKFKTGEAGLYFLLYQICPFDHRIESTFTLDFDNVNYDSSGYASYLTAGEMSLPTIYFFFSVSYFLCFMVWFVNIRQIQGGSQSICLSGGENRPAGTVYPIHHIMSVLVFTKFLAVFFESLRYHFLRTSGHAEFWTVIYYGVAFVKGAFLFTVILLIGSGWSFVKPFLNNKEKIVVFCVLLLQVVNNIALVVLSQETVGEDSYGAWTATLHLVDIVCCCAVLAPLVLQINALEKNIRNEDHEENLEEKGNEPRQTRFSFYNPSDDSSQGSPVLDSAVGVEAVNNHGAGEKDHAILGKLKLFRSFYLLVVAYIYSTRVLIYLFASVLSYKLLWVRHFVLEVINLTFYVSVGFMFRPTVDNPYLSLKQASEDPEDEVGISLGKI